MNERYHFLRFLVALIIIGLAVSACKEPEPVMPKLTGTVIITGIAAIEETLTADTDSLGGTGTISYQWKRGPSNIGDNRNTYVVQAEDFDSTITVTVTRSGYSGNCTSDPTSAVTLPRLTGTVSIIGIASVGQPLIANADFLADDGDLSYLWKRETDAGDAIVIGDNYVIYVVEAADLGCTITVTITGSGYFGSFTSEPTAVVTLPALTGTVRITGNPWVGQTLTAVTALIGTGNISYQWVRVTGDGDAIGIGGNSRTYEVQAADEDYTITVTVTREGYSGEKTSAPTADIILPPLTGTVRITGNSFVGQTLTANTASLAGTGNISYQWMRGTVGDDIVNVGTNSTYLLESSDANNYINVTVTRSGNSGAVNSIAVMVRSLASGEYIKKVEFTGQTATVGFENLSNQSVYLVKLNASESQVSATATGSVQSISLLSSDNRLSSPLPRAVPRMGHPAAMAANENPPPIVPETSKSLKSLAEFVPPVVGSTRAYFVETSLNSGRFEPRPATLMATGLYSNIWVMNNGISTAQAQALATNFDKIYPAETNILGYEFGGGPGGDGGKDGDPKIQILVYNIGGSIIGYFWNKDFYDDQAGTNKAEIFYINSSSMNTPDLIYLTLAHEFQHMINFNQKYVKNGLTAPTWYNETLSMMTEDIMAEILGISMSNQHHPIRDHIPYFIENYTDNGFTEWIVYNAYPYSKGYAFGAYLMRNFGGVDLLRRILANNTTGIESITAALSELIPGLNFDQVMSRFGEAMIFSGNVKPEGTLTFDKTVTSTITAHNGTHTYTLRAFDVWNTSRYSQSAYGPVVYPTAQRTMRGHSVLVQQDDSWKYITGSFSVTLNRPSDSSIEFYLMVR